MIIPFSKKLKEWPYEFLHCCVFRPAFGCSAVFNFFVYFERFFSDFTPEINKKHLKMNRKATKKVENVWKKYFNQLKGARSNQKLVEKHNTAHIILMIPIKDSGDLNSKLVQFLKVLSNSPVFECNLNTGQMDAIFLCTGPVFKWSVHRGLWEWVGTLLLIFVMVYPSSP